jgi:hypothetical protein
MHAAIIISTRARQYKFNATDCPTRNKGMQQGLCPFAKWRVLHAPHLLLPLKSHFTPGVPHVKIDKRFWKDRFPFLPVVEDRSSYTLFPSAGWQAHAPTLLRVGRWTTGGDGRWSTRSAASR